MGPLDIDVDDTAAEAQTAADLRALQERLAATEERLARVLDHLRILGYERKTEG